MRIIVILLLVLVAVTTAFRQRSHMRVKTQEDDCPMQCRDIEVCYDDDPTDEIYEYCCGNPYDFQAQCDACQANGCNLCSNSCSI